MIKSTNRTALNMASDFEYHCDNCGQSGHLHLESFINIPEESSDGVCDIYDQHCPSCDFNLKNRLIMRLDNEPFYLIKDGHKTIEVRLNDAKRQSIDPGDIISFINNKTGHSLDVKVINLLRYPNFDSLFDSCNVYDFGSNNKILSVEKMRNYYSREDEKEYGVLGIKIKLI